ncbi:MAG: hypothetical protein ACOYL3_22870 [Desulfuromonadaceae bacterium]
MRNKSTTTPKIFLAQENYEDIDMCRDCGARDKEFHAVNCIHNHPCPQCAAYAAGINSIVRAATDEKNHREEAFTKRCLDEVKLLNIRSYVSLIDSALDTACNAEKYPEGYKVISAQTWSDIHLLIFHIENTLAELLPEE